MISRLDTGELDFITNLSSDGATLIDQWHGMNELQVAEIDRFLSHHNSRNYPELDSVIIDEMHELEKNQMNSNTMNQT